MNAYRELMRRKLLEDMYGRMSSEEKQSFVQLMEHDERSEIAQELLRQGREVDEIHQKVSKQTWLSDFSSNVAGNAVWDGLVWIGSRILRKL